MRRNDTIRISTEGKMQFAMIKYIVFSISMFTIYLKSNSDNSVTYIRKRDKHKIFYLILGYGDEIF